MGLLKSMKNKLSSKEDRDQRTDSSSDQKYAYQTQSSSPEISYGDNGIFQRSKSPLNKPSQNASFDEAGAYASPPGPPPEVEPNPPPYESWLAVPDNSQLPPPPGLAHDSSPSNNASFDSAAAGHQWCDTHPVYTPSVPNPTLLQQSQTHDLNVESPPHSLFRGKLTKLDPQTWQITSPRSQKQDTIVTSVLPAYFAAVSNPLLPTNSSSPQGAFTVRFTTIVTSLPSPESVLAIGLTSKPYPPFRLPGWHRSSVAVHSDDGRRYTNDPHGGIDFISPFLAHDQIVFTFTVFPRASPVQQYRGNMPVRPVGGGAGLPKCVCTVEVERNGRREGGWEICEERDAETDEGVEGLQGDADLYVAIGVCGEVGCQVRFG